MIKWARGRPEWAMDEICPLYIGEIDSFEECAWGVEEERDF